MSETRDEAEFGAGDEMYHATVRAGKEMLPSVKMLVLMLARDCAKRLANNLLTLDCLMSRCHPESSAIVLENDSVDATREVLQEACDRYSWLGARCLSLGKRKWPQVRSLRRAAHMAWYRNECRSYGLHVLPHPDLVLVLDPDVAWFSTDGIAHSIGMHDSWDVCASNGLRRDQGTWVQADAWAFRSAGWAPKVFSEVRRFTPDRGSPLVPMKCAFGGMALYKGAQYKQPDTFYDGDDCEHVGLCKRFGGTVVLNPSQIVVYRW